MIKNLLQLEGVSKLSKKSLSKIGGGYTCKIKTTMNDGSVNMTTMDFSFDPSGNANSVCVQSIMENASISRCQYDCNHDGFSPRFEAITSA
ncbi:hypothetical protein [Tenacibaculum sp. 190524A05c]|uniref:Uncharacterized protein n=1 Tax=Tenacibaculum platacis TaxID=3137852 RepID=A0ABP1ELB5_9FLAO